MAHASCLDPLWADLILNTVLNLLNKWALGSFGFKFPMILTAAHMLFGSLALLPLMTLKPKYRERHVPILKQDWKALLFVGCINGPQIAANNASLVTIELSLNQVIRATIPVCVATFALCLESKIPTVIGAFCTRPPSGLNAHAAPPLFSSPPGTNGHRPHRLARVLLTRKSRGRVHGSCLASRANQTSC